MTSTAADTSIAIRVRDVRKKYGDVLAVDGVSFDVAAGEVFGLLGPNGAGKTTTVEMLEGLRPPDDGELTVLGIDARRDSASLKPRIGVALQTAALYPKLTVTEILELFASFYPRSRPVGELIDALGLGERRTAQSRELSGGQRQRLAVALALVNDPELLFLDEPTTGLDPAARRALWDLVMGLKEGGKTILLTTHYLEEAEVLCDRIAIMDHGKVLEMGTVDELVSRHFTERAVRFDRIDTIEDNALAALPAVSSVKHDDDEVLLYTADVAATIGALLVLADSRGVEPQNLADPPALSRGCLPRPHRPGAARLTRTTSDARPSPADDREHPELHPGPGGRLLDARLPADLHPPVRVHLLGRQLPDPAGLGRRGRLGRLRAAEGGVRAGERRRARHRDGRRDDLGDEGRLGRRRGDRPGRLRRRAVGRPGGQRPTGDGHPATPMPPRPRAGRRSARSSTASSRR